MAQQIDAPMLIPHNKLISHWKSQNLRIAPGNPVESVCEFESRNSVTLPADFRDYFLNVDGMVQSGGDDCDQGGFSFWPLARLRSVPEECAQHRLAAPGIESPDEYFVFADYLQWSWAYAIRLTSGPLEANPVIHVGTLRPRVVADSFSQFVDLYLRDAEELYPARD